MKICTNCSARFDASDWRCPSCGRTPPAAAGHFLLAPALTQGDSGFKDKYFEELAELEGRNFWFRSRNALILMVLRKHFPGMSRLLEIGCGTGYVLAGIEQAFPAARLAGSEIFSSALAFAARRLARAELFQMDARHIPFEDEFDVIGAFDVIEHIEEDERVLGGIYKALRAGGGVILTVPQHPFLWSRQDEQACHVRRYTRRELETRLVGAGFEIMYAASFVSLLLPLMMASRLKKNIDRTPDALDELRLHPILNATLEQVMKLERAMTRAGLALPFGGSLLMVARKPLSRGHQE